MHSTFSLKPEQRLILKSDVLNNQCIFSHAYGLKSIAYVQLHYYIQYVSYINSVHIQVVLMYKHGFYPHREKSKPEPSPAASVSSTGIQRARAARPQDSYLIVLLVEVNPGSLAWNELSMVHLSETPSSSSVRIHTRKFKLHANQASPHSSTTHRGTRIIR